MELEFLSIQAQDFIEDLSAVCMALYNANS